MGIIEIKTPNGIKITAYIIQSIGNTHICYAQNKLFTVFETFEFVDGEIINELYYGDIIIDYCVIPELDNREREETSDNSGK